MFVLQFMVNKGVRYATQPQLH